MGTYSLAQLAASLRSYPSALVAKLLAALVPIECYEITNPAASSNVGLLAATASTVAVQTYLKAQLLGAGIAVLNSYPRRVTFTTGGATRADAPASATITGLDGAGQVITETVSIGQTATTVSSVKFFSDITSIVYTAGDGASATVSIGWGAAIGFKRKPMLRNAAVAALVEFTDGVPSGTRGTYITPASGGTYGGVTFNTAPDGVHDYTIWFEADLS